MAFRARRWLAALVLGSAATTTLAWPVDAGAAPQRREFLIKARQYAYDPPVLRVQRGDEVHIRLASLDVVHGFWLEGHDLDAQVEPARPGFLLRHPSRGDAFAPVAELVFTAARSGKFRYRCSHTCGYLHPFMMGELIVAPDRLFPLAVALVVGVLAGGLVLAWPRRAGHAAAGAALP